MTAPKRRLVCLAAVIIAVATIVPIASGFITALTNDRNRSESSQATATPTDEELPVIYLTTDDGQKVNSKDYYKTGKMRMTVPQSFRGYDNPYATDDGGIMKIRCRGNSTFGTSDRLLGKGEKFSYKIKLDKKANLLGMGKSKHWVLIANFFDVTNMRNKLTYDLSGRMGLTYTQSRWVIVYLNGEYRGIYTLCENVRIASDRVAIPDWEDRAEDVVKAIAKANSLDKTASNKLEEDMTNNLSWITSGYFGSYKISDYYDTSDFDITSGYLIEYDERMDGDTTKFRTSHNKPIQLDNPKALSTNKEMYNYVVNLLNDFEEAIYSPDFCTKDGRHYSELCDVDSLIDYFLVFNLFKNIEFGWLSIFLYINNGKIYFGPCWDFDGASANQVTLTEDWYPYDKWFNMGGRADWWKELCGDPYYVARAADRWFEIRPLVDEMMDVMPSYYKYIKDETERDSVKYGMPKNWYMTWKSCTDFDTEYGIFRTWMFCRIDWLDKQFSLRDPNIEGRGLNPSEKLTAKIGYSDSTSLQNDNLSVAEYPADYIYDPNNKKDLVLEISTRHTSHRKVKVFVNGKLVTTAKLTMDSPAKVTIPSNVLDRSENGINVIYFSCLNHNDSFYREGYLSVRSRSVTARSENECVVRLQDNKTLKVSKGSTIKLPGISVKEDGYTCIGWTPDGEKVYAAGSNYVVNSDVRFLYKWKRNELFPDHTTPKTEPPKTETKPPVTTTPPPSTTTTTTTKITTSEKPTTTLPPTTSGKPTTSLPMTTTLPGTTTSPGTTTPAATTTEKKPITSSGNGSSGTTGGGWGPITPTTTAAVTTNASESPEKTPMKATTIIILIAVCVVGTAAVVIAVIVYKKRNE